MARYDLGTARGTIEIDASSLGRATAALRTSGLALTGIGVAAVAGVGVAVNEAAKFEQKMSAVEAVLGKGVGPAMDQIREKALQLGSSTIFGAQAVASAMEDLAKAGLNAQEIIGGAADATVQLAAASGGTIDLARAAEIAANAMRTFNLGAGDMVHVADQIAGAANASTLEVDDVATSLRYVGPVAHAAGLSLDEVATTLAVLGDRGIRGSTAGTSLRGVLLGLQPSSKKASDAMKELGLITKDGSNQFFDASGNMKSMSEIAGILHTAFSGLSEEQKVSAANSIFQRRAMASALVIAEQGSTGFDQYAASIAKTSAAEVAAKRLDNLKGDIKLLQAQIETTLIKAGTPFQQMLRGWVQSITKIIKAFGDLSPGTQKLILQIVAAAGALAAALGSFLLFASVILKVFRIIVDLKEAWAVLSTVFEAAGAAIGAVISPFVIVIAIIVAVIAILVLLYFKVQAVRDFIDKAVDAIAGFFIDMWNKYIYPALQAFIGFLIGDVIPAIKQFVQTASDVWHTVSDAVVAMWHAVYPVLQSFWEWLNKNLFPVFAEFGRLVAAVADRVAQNISSMWKLIYPLLKLAQKEFNYLAELFSTLLPVALNILRTIFITVWNQISGAVAVAISIIRGAMQILVGLFKVIEPILTFFKDQFVNAFNFVVTLIESFLQIIKGVFEFLRGVVTLDWGTMWEGIQDIFGGAVKAVLALLSYFWNLFIGLVTAGIETVVRFFTEMPGRIIRAIGDVVKLLLQKGFDIINGLWDGIKRTWDSVLKWFGEKPAELLKAIPDPIKLLVQIGKDIIQGLINGITGLTSKVTDAVSSIAGKIKDAFTNPFHLGSPSRVMHEVGKNIMLGLHNGMQSILPAVKQLVGETTDTIASIGANPEVALGLSGNGLASSLGLGVPTSTGTQAAATSTVDSHDTFNLEAKTDADPEEIVNGFMFAKRFRS